MPTLLENFKAGDLLYGVHKDRKAVMESLAQLVGEENLFTADRINNITGASVEAFRPQKEAEKILEDLNPISKKIYPAYKSRFTKYYNFLGQLPGSRYNPDAINSKKTKDRKITIYEEDVLLRRSCKNILLFAARNGITVHFILDSFLENPTTAQDGFTVSELNFIVKNPGIWNTPFMKFYVNGKQIKNVDAIHSIEYRLVKIKGGRGIPEYQELGFYSKAPKY